MSNSGKTILAAILMAAFCASALGREPALAEYRAVQESLSRVHPRIRASWLRERGLDDSPYATFRKPDSGSGLRAIGRWPWGPSWELCGRDSLLFLGSGSGVRILSISDSIHPRQLGQIVARSLVTQLVIRDTLLFIACGTWGAQIYSVSDPANPVELGSMDAVTLDLCVRDTLCFTVGGDSLRIYNVADPQLPVQLSAARDSGELVVVSGTHVYAAWDGMNVYDVSNPLSPNRINTRGGKCYTLFIQDTLLFCSAIQPSYFAILDISDPLDIQQIGYISGYGGHALYVDDSFAYLSCAYDHEGIFVINVTNPTNPQVRGSYDPEGTENYDPYVPTPLSYGYLASDYGGLKVVDLHNVDLVTEASSSFEAHQAVDLSIDGSLAYVADQAAGLRILDVSDPTRPATLGIYDTIAVLDVRSAVARDSFAFITYWGDRRRFLRVLDVSNPTAPTFAAEESCRNPPDDMVLRDSFLYCAEVNQFQIFNVARPREPVLVGGCVTTDGINFGLVVQDTFAYLIGDVFQVINIARPSAPVVVSSTAGGAAGLAVRDTFAYIPSGWDSVYIYSVANPASTRRISSIPCGVWPWDAALGESKLYIATSDGWGVDVYDLADPGHPARRGRASAPTDIRRLCYHDGHVYAALWNAGIAIYETTAAAVAEAPPAVVRRGAGMSVHPSPTRGRVVLELPPGLDRSISVLDAAGRRILLAETAHGGERAIPLDLSQLKGGVYFIEVRSKEESMTAKVVKN
jgi:hypothetical protein